MISQDLRKTHLALTPKTRVDAVALLVAILQAYASRTEITLTARVLAGNGVPNFLTGRDKALKKTNSTFC